MTDPQTLYAEVKPDIEVVSLRLFDLSKKFLDGQGAFLPHAAVLTDGGGVELIGAAGDKDRTTAAEILPLLHGGLRHFAATKALTAVGVAEDVSIVPPGQPRTRAIKVLFEHRRGIAVALYQPFSKSLFRFKYGAMFSVQAKGEVNAWASPPRA
jgi:hypothetical protein